MQSAKLRDASKQLSQALEEFAHPSRGAAPRVKETLSWMKADLESAADHIRAQMNGLGKELYHTIAVLCLAALAMGFFVGILYHRWLDSPVQPEKAPVPAVQSISPASSSATPEPTHKKRLTSKPSGQGQ